MTRATTYAEAYAARWPGNTRAEFDRKRQLVNQDMEAFVEQLRLELRAKRLAREGK